MIKKDFVGVDFDGTLSKKDGSFKGPDFIGEPIVDIVNLVKEFLEKGIEVKIFSARVSKELPEETVKIAEKTIKSFCLEHFGQELEVTADKSPWMGLIIDDKAISVKENLGQLCSTLEMRERIADAFKFNQ